jgi:predicted dehydrogenase
MTTLTSLRWGILGTGNIAGQFTRDLRSAERSVVGAVASRSQDSADAFARQWDLPRAHGSYDALLNDDTVDAVYLSLPNTMHAQWTIKALRAGKHVLCEKPLAMSGREAQAMFAAAADAKRTLIEAFMWRAQPLTHTLLEHIQQGSIGQLRHIDASFCYATKKIDGNIRFDPALGGGALMDIGCYCLSFGRLFAQGEPESFEVFGHVHESGVDDYGCGVVRYPGGLVMTFRFAMTVQSDNTAMLSGTDGWIEVPIPWKPPARGASFILKGQRPPKMDHSGTNPEPPGPQMLSIDSPAELYAIQADAFVAVVQDNAQPFMPPKQSIAQAQLLQAMRKRLGLSY